MGIPWGIGLNEDIRKGLEIANIKGKIKENRLRWFVYVQIRRISEPVRKIVWETYKEGEKTEGDLIHESENWYEESSLTNWNSKKSKWMEKKNPCGRPLKMI